MTGEREAVNGEKGVDAMRSNIKEMYQKYYKGILADNFPASIDALCDLALIGLDAEWRPIESAPKDDFVLTFGPIKENYSTRILMLTDKGWFSQANGYQREINYPTHWRPLPPSPSAEGK